MAGIDRVWVTRAHPGAQRTADRLTALGFSPAIAPLLAIQSLDVEIDLSGIQALAFTSMNGVTAFAELSTDRTLPVFAVGDATARAAHEMGFTRVRSANGDLNALAALICAEAKGLSILNPCAAEPAGNLASSVGDTARVRSIPVYEARETGAAPPDRFDAVLIHSPRAGRALAMALDGITTTAVAAAISPAAAAPLAGLGFARVRIAATPDENALLATLGKPGASV